jgi:hypothetical protein
MFMKLLSRTNLAPMCILLEPLMGCNAVSSEKIHQKSPQYINYITPTSVGIQGGNFAIIIVPFWIKSNKEF